MPACYLLWPLRDIPCRDSEATCGVEGESAEGSGSVCHVTTSCLAKTLTTRSLVCVRFNEAWHGRGAVRELGLSGSVRNMRISSSGVYQPTSLGPKTRRGHSLVTTGRIRFSEFHALGRSLKQDSVAKFPELETPNRASENQQILSQRIKCRALCENPNLIMPLQQIECSFGYSSNKIPIYPIFYLLRP